MQTDRETLQDFQPPWAGGSAGVALARGDWRASDLGDCAGWPAPLRTAAAMVLHSPLPMFLAWGPSLTFIANEALRSLLGEPVDAVQARSLPQRWPELARVVEPLLRSALAGGSGRLDDVSLGRPHASPAGDGQADHADALGHFGLASSPVYDANGRVAGVHAVVSDSADRLRLEADLMRAEAGAAHVLQGVDEAFMLMDAEFRIVQANAVTLRMDGRPETEILGRSHWDVWPLSVGSELERAYRRAMQRRESVVIEQRVVGAHAAAVHADAIGVAAAGAAQPVLHLEIRAFPFADGLAVFARDVSARKQAQQREATLLEFVDRVRELDDPVGIAGAAAEIAGRALRVSRAGYATLDATEQWAVIERDWTAPGVRSIVGTHHMLSFGSDFLAALRAGEAVVLSDVATDARTSGAVANFAHIGVTALLNIPLIERGRLAAILFLHEQRPRRWSEADISLWTEIGHRAWAAADRARARQEARLGAERLHASETRFRRLADLGPSIVWLGHADGTLSYLNDRWYEFTGQTPTQALPMGWVDVVHPDDLPTLERNWADARLEAGAYNAEARLRRVDGEYRWYLISAVPIVDDADAVSWLGSNVDIHDRKVREDAVRDQRDRIWNLSTDLMIVARIDGTVEAVNPAWQRLLGWTEDELVGQKLIDFVHPDDVLATLAELSTLANGKTTLRFENRYRRRDGEWLPLSWTAVPGVGSLHAVGRDMSAEKAAAATLQRTEDALRQSQKMEAVGQLTGGIAHDFNNLLQGITGSLDLVKRRLSQGRAGEIEKFVTSAMSSASRAAALTHRLLAFSRRQPLDPRPVKTNQLVASMDDLLRRTMGERIEIEMVMAAGLWVTLCDPNQLESALLNLAINARDAMPDGGKLTIETGNSHLDGAYAASHTEIRPGQYVCLSVSDNGCGMGRDVIERAFEPFFTTKPTGQGTGLGLSMIYGFARQSEGYADIYSELGRGTTVKLYLPRFRGDNDDDEPVAAPAASEPTGADEVVLVVEDEPIVRGLIVDVLSEMGYAVVEAGDGPAGLAILQSRQRVDLLLTDIGLPGLNGRQVADAARIFRPDLKVLFMTGYAENAALASGFLDHRMEMITKPFALETLATRIRAFMDAPGWFDAL